MATRVNGWTGHAGTRCKYRLFRYGTLRRLIEQAAAQAPVSKLLQEHAVIRDLSVYAQLV